MAPMQPFSATNGVAHTTNGTQTSKNSIKPIILHLGDPILYNKAHYSRFELKFDIIRPELSELHRDNFIKHLKDKTWGDFSAIIRPFWNTGGEMGMWDRELIELLPRSLKVIASAGAGFDWVRTDVLGEHGILYTNGAGASTGAVADMALWLIISVFRQMTWTSLAARSNDVEEYRTAHREVMYQSHNPNGHRLGIVGLGHIGSAIAKKVKAALDMEIIYYDVKRKPYENKVDATFYSPLDELLRHSDCVLLASPHGQPILDARTLALLPRGARVVNIARGSLIDEDALADSLESGHISAAGLDVHTHEPKPSPRLQSKNNVTLTCHTGGGSVDTVEGFEKLVMENAEAVLEGREPLTAVNKDCLGVPVTDDGQRSTTLDGEVGVNGHHEHTNGSH